MGEKHSKNKSNGITLIALIITIIVMLILVSVSVQILINSNLIGIAENAGNKTKTAYNEEANMGEITIGDGTYNSIDEYMQSKCTHEYGEWTVVKEATYQEAGERYRTCTKCGLMQTEYPTKLECTEHDWTDWTTVTAATCQATGKEKKECTKCGTTVEQEIAITGHGYANGVCPTCGATSTLTIGATIDYKEYISSEGTAFTEMPSYTSTDDKNGYTDTIYTVANNSGIEWIVLGEENGQIKITTKNVVQPSSGGYTSGNFKLLRLKGQAGYANFVEELHEISAIYGKGKYADTSKFTVTTGGQTGGRSFIREDLGYDTLTRTAAYTYAMHDDGYVYRHEVGEEIDLTTAGTTGGTRTTFKYMTMDASNTTEETENGKVWNELKTQANEGPTSVTIYNYTYSGRITLSSTVRKADTYYWLASRYVDCNSDNVDFDTRCVTPDGTGATRDLYNSRGGANDDEFGVRPVVYLDTGVQLTYNSSSNSYTIK